MIIIDIPQIETTLVNISHALMRENRGFFSMKLLAGPFNKLTLTVSKSHYEGPLEFK